MHVPMRSHHCPYCRFRQFEKTHSSGEEDILCYWDEETVGFGIRRSIGFGLGKSTSFAIRKSIGLAMRKSIGFAMRKSIGFVMRKSLNQSFVRSLLCGEHSSMGKCAELWERDLFDLQKKCICFNLRESDLLNFQKMHLHPWSPLLLPWSLRRQVWILQINLFLQFHPFLWFHAISIMFFLNSNCVFHDHLIKLILSYIPISYFAS